MSRLSEMVYKMRGINNNKKEAEFIQQMEMGTLPPYKTPKLRVRYGVVSANKRVDNDNRPGL